MVERALCMREVGGSMLASSIKQRWREAVYSKVLYHVKITNGNIAVMVSVMVSVFLF